MPSPTTLMKLTRRCGEEAVAGLNEALWAKAAQARLLRTAGVRADTTVIAANVAYPTDSGLLARAVGKLVRAARRVQAAGGAPDTAMTDRRRAAARRVREIASKLRGRSKLGQGGDYPGHLPDDRPAGRPRGESRCAGCRSVAQRSPRHPQDAQRPDARQAAPGAG